MLGGADGERIAEEGIQAFEEGRVEAGDGEAMDMATLCSLLSDPDVADEIVRAFCPDIADLIGARNWPRKPFLVCSCSSRCMVRLARQDDGATLDALFARLHAAKARPRAGKRSASYDDLPALIDQNSWYSTTTATLRITARRRPTPSGLRAGRTARSVGDAAAARRQ